MGYPPNASGLPLVTPHLRGDDGPTGEFCAHSVQNSGQKNILKFMKKHRNPLVYRTACLLIILFFAVRLPAWFVIAFFKRNQTGEAAIKSRAYFAGIVSILFGGCYGRNKNEYIHKTIQD